MRRPSPFRQADTRPDQGPPGMFEWYEDGSGKCLICGVQVVTQTVAGIKWHRATRKHQETAAAFGRLP